MIYRFCLSSDTEHIHEITIPEDDQITWNNLLKILQEKINMSKITYLELCDSSFVRIGERIHDIDDFQYALKCYENGMIFKVFGKLAISNGIVVTKKSSKSPRLQESLDSLMIPSPTTTYNPLDDFQASSLRKSSSSSLTPRETDNNSSPQESKVFVKKPRQLLSTVSSDSSSSEAVLEKSFSYTPPISLSTSNHVAPVVPLSTSNHVAPVVSYLEKNDSYSEAEEPFSHDEDLSPCDSVIIENISSKDISPPVDISPVEEVKHPTPDTEDLESSDLKNTSIKAVESQTIVSKQSEPEVCPDNKELTLDHFTNSLSLDFTSSLQSILAGLSRLEDSIVSPSLTEPIREASFEAKNSNPLPSTFHFGKSDLSRPNMASLKTSAELEAERLEQEAIENKRKQDEEARKLEIQTKERHHNTKVPLQEPLRSEKNVTSLVSVPFVLANNMHNCVTISVASHSDWQALVNSVAQEFNIVPGSITHFVLLDEDNDEISGKLNDRGRFWKIFEKYDTLGGRSFCVHYDQSRSSLPISNFNKEPETPLIENSKYVPRSQVSDAPSSVNKQPEISLIEKNKYVPQSQVSNAPTSEVQSPVTESYDFRLSTDYIDEKTSISLLKNSTFETITSTVLNNLSNITPAQKLTSSISKFSLFDDDGDEIVANIDNEESFWKVVNSRYKKNSTVFVATLLASPTVAQPASSSVPPLTHSIFCRLANGSKKEAVLFPISSNWEQITNVVCNHWKLKNKSISTISLFDEENDELFGGITDEKKFWKCYKTHYNKQLTEFVFKMIDTQPPIQQQNGQQESISLQFRLSSNSKEILTIDIPLQSSWDIIASILVERFRLNPKQFRLEHIDLVDLEGDKYGTFTQDQKFWKSVKTTYQKASNMYYDCTFREEVVVLSPKLSEVNTKCLSRPLNFQLIGENLSKKVSVIEIPENSSWTTIQETIIQYFNYGIDSVLNSFMLVDSDGDDLVGIILNDKKFWKVVTSSYTENCTFLIDMTIVQPLKSSDSQTGISLYFCTTPENFIHKKIVLVPPHTTWEELGQILQQTFHTKESTLISIKLIDEDGDEYCENISDSDKFWKIVNTRYSHSGDIAFIFLMKSNSINNNTKKLLKNDKNTSSSTISEISSQKKALKPTRPYQFRLHHEEDNNMLTIINIPEKGNWDEITQSIKIHYNFPHNTLITHLDLLDEDGDELTSGIQNENKFWKFLQKNQNSNIYFIIWYEILSQNDHKNHKNHHQINSHEDDTSSSDTSHTSATTSTATANIVPLYFRLCTDSLTDKGVIEIPLLANWELIIKLLIEFFEINISVYSIESMDLVDDDGQMIISNIITDQQLWNIIQNKYNYNYMVFVINIKQVKNILFYKFQYDRHDEVLIGIYEESTWDEIITIICSKLSLSITLFHHLSLVDDEGDEIFSKIFDERKFWKAAKSKYIENETIFVVHTSSPSSSSLSSDIAITSKENSSSSSSSLTSRKNLGSQSSTTIINGKKNQTNSQDLPSPPLPPPAPAPAPAPAPSQATISGHRTTTTTPLYSQIDPSKFEGRFVGLSFKLSTEEYENEQLISIPAMGSWEQICDTISRSYPNSLSSSIDRLELLDDEGNLLLTNIVSSSKFWKACLELYRENETIFNIHLSSSSSPSISSNKSHHQSTTSGSAVSVPVPVSVSTSSSSSSSRKVLPKKQKVENITLESYLQACSDDHNLNLIIDIIQHANNQNFNLLSTDEKGLSSLHIAAIHGSINIAKILIDYSNTFLTIKDYEGMTPLHYACEVNHTELIHYMIQYGADLLLRNKLGLTSLHYIAINGNMELAHYIPDNMINIATNNGLTLLHFASDMGHFFMIKYLILHHANIHLKDDEGLIPLHLACISNHLECVKLLIKLGSYCNLRDDNGMSCLLHCCKEGNLDIVKYLCDENIGGNLLARNNHYDSCLHLACYSGSLPLIKYLIQKKVIDINARNEDGETPLEIASKLGYEKIVSWLEDRGGIMRPETKDEMLTRKQIDMKSEKAIRAYEEEEFLKY